MISQAASFVLLTMTGMILSVSLAFHCLLNLTCSRVRLKLRDGTPGYNMTSNFFLRCLYEGEVGDSTFPQVGFLKGPLLLCVSALCTHLCSTPDHWFYSRHIVIYLYHHLPQWGRMLPKSPAGDEMLPPLFVWMVESLLVLLHILQHKYVYIHFYHCLDIISSV